MSLCVIGGSVSLCVIGGSGNVRGDDSIQQAQHHTKKRTSVSLKMAIRGHSHGGTPAAEYDQIRSNRTALLKCHSLCGPISSEMTVHGATSCIVEC